MPNNYVNQVFIMGWPPDESEPLAHWNGVLARLYAEPPEWSHWPHQELMNMVLPISSFVTHCSSDFRVREHRKIEWAMENWGTKWGTYNHQPLRAIGGDIPGVVLVFETANSPPHEGARSAVAAWLFAKGARGVAWIGVDPYDRSFHMLGNWGKPEEKEEEEDSDLLDDVTQRGDLPTSGDPHG